MNKDTRFSIHSRAKSFLFAFEGVIHFFRKEHNAWLHLVATTAVAVMGILLRVTRSETIALVIAVALVWICEILNTCVEKTMDMITTEYDTRVKHIKDLSAGAVLVAAAAAAIIGLVVFLPKFIHA
jgi:diacylglycerol kinase (ATP)